jgi:uncharacterized damage-inducible protein DinB
MEVKQFIKGQLEGAAQGIKRVIDSLTQVEIAWRPGSGCNSIGLILFHIYKTEDSFIQTNLNNKKELWETGKWYQKLGLDVTEASAHYTVEQVNAFKVPKLKAIVEYGEAASAATLAYLDTLKAADFDKEIKMRFGPLPMAVVFSILVSHAAQHTGEISYLRGLQRGMDK